MWGFSKSQHVGVPEIARHATWVPYRSPLLGDLGRFLDRHRGAFVLDLSTMRTANVTFYARFSSKVFVEDIASDLTQAREEQNSLESRSTEASDQAPAQAEDVSPLDSFVKHKAKGAYELFMCWDIFNYLDFDKAALLAADATRIASKNAMVYMLTWNSRTMPESPLAFDILEGDNLQYDDSSINRLSSPRWSLSQIRKLFPEFERTRSFLSRTGLEEHLLVRKSS